MFLEAKELFRLISEFDGFTANVLTLAAAATNPAAVAGLAIAKYVFSLVADTMMGKKDDQIGMVYQSFNRFEHYPHGEKKRMMCLI